MNIRMQLESLAEPDFQKFTSKLIPNIRPETILGVRLPKLRVLAKELAKDDWRGYLADASDESFEEIMLQGLVIGYAKAELSEILEYVKSFLPKIDNWSVCDSFCATLKFPKQYSEQVWEFLLPYFKDACAYYIRFAVVMFLDYYVDAAHLEEGLCYLEEIVHEDYYVKMAVAWAISVCFMKMPEETMPFLKQNKLDDFTYNKALQKITESFKIEKEIKQKIRQMKRKQEEKKWKK